MPSHKCSTADNEGSAYTKTEGKTQCFCSLSSVGSSVCRTNDSDDNDQPP